MTRPEITMMYTALDAPDPARLANFYSEVLGWPLVESDSDWATIESPGKVQMAFQFAPDFVAVDWPSEGVRSHMDLQVADMDVAEKWVLSLGARLLEGSGDHPTFRVYADPVGHVFCLCHDA